MLPSKILSPFEKPTAGPSASDELMSKLSILRSTQSKALAYLEKKEYSLQVTNSMINAFDANINAIISVTSGTKLPEDDWKPKVSDARKIRSRLELLLVKPPPSPVVTSQQAVDISAVWDMPVLKIPSFAGDVTKYRFYRRILKAKIVDNPNMTVTAKWHYFLESLSDRPAQLVSNYPKTEPGLASALAGLDKVFDGSAKNTKDELLREYHGLGATTQDVDTCRLIHSRIEGVLLSLVELGHSVDTDNDILGTYAYKFPSVVRFKDTSLTEMRKTMGDFILNLERDEASKKREAEKN